MCVDRYLGYVRFQNHDLEEISQELYAYLKSWLVSKSHCWSVVSHEISPLRPYEISINNYTTHKQLLLVKPPIFLVKFNYYSSIFLVKPHVFLVKTTMFSGLNANLFFVVCSSFLGKISIVLFLNHIFLLVNQLINHHFPLTATDSMAAAVPECVLVVLTAKEATTVHLFSMSVFLGANADVGLVSKWLVSIVSSPYS